MKTWFLKYLKPIRTKKDYKSALKIIDRYFDAKPNTPEGMLIEILSMLVEKYEEDKFPIEAPHPIEAIKFRMEQMGITGGKFALMIGSRSRASEILNKKRSLSIRMIRKLHKEMRIPAESLIGAYPRI
jgi:HTH-type transcriptional regulator/antitoxin HigA